MVFSECTEAITASLIPLETLLPEECVFIIGFSCTVWIKIRSFAGSIADGAPFKFHPAHQNKEGKGSSKVRKGNDKRWLNTSLKSTETRDELSTTLYHQSNINFL